MTYGLPRGWLVTFHVVGAVMWMGGLMALARLLRYHAGEPPSARPTLSRIEGRLDWAFAIPGALVSVACGLALLRMYGLDWLRVSLWMQVKLGLVGVVVLCHLGATRAQWRLARRDPSETVRPGSWRSLNALVLLLLIAIIGLSIHQPMVGGR